ncbi:MAG TPA: cyclic nucleotide-binding domain-containing protein [Nocardioidaceae bacterium]|nr:cyclic nucleotide-binding domain-containing protein [Nocardioidaceae bacterium]
MSEESSPDPARLARLELFAAIAPAQLTHVAGLMEEREVPAGEHAVRQGDQDDAFYVIESGAAEVSVDDVVVRRLDAGDFFGEIAPLRFGRRTASVVALTDLTLFSLSRFNLRFLAASNPAIAQRLEVAARERLETASPKPPAE